MEKIPCKDCLCFPVCQHKLKNIIEYKATRFYIVLLCEECNLFGDWWVMSSSFEISSSILGILNEYSM